jgi:hypothetical protein
MCRFCDHIKTEITRLQHRLAATDCHKKRRFRGPLKHPQRQTYWQKYYEANKAKKIKAANERNKRLREQKDAQA